MIARVRGGRMGTVVPSPDSLSSSPSAQAFDIALTTSMPTPRPDSLLPVGG